MPLVVGGTGELSKATHTLMTKAGATDKQIKQLFASLLKCLDILFTAKDIIVTPIYQAYRDTKSGKLLSDLAVLRPYSVPSFQWTPVMEDHILWPHVSILHMIATALPMHILLPDRDSYMSNVPHGSLTFNQYWFIHSQGAPAHWPRALGTSIPTFALFDWVHPILPKGVFAGKVMWVMGYGLSEHSRCITAI